MASDSWACEAQAALVGEATDAEVIDLEDWRDDQKQSYSNPRSKQLHCGHMVFIVPFS